MSRQRSVLLLLLVLAATASGVELHVDPSGLWLIPEDTNMTLTLGLSFNSSNPLDVNLEASGSQLIVRVVPDEDWKLDFVNNAVEFSVKEIHAGINKSIMLSGYYWGRTQLSFYLIVDHLDGHDSVSYLNGTLLRDDITVGVNRAFSLVDNIFMVIGTLFIFINTINMGCELNLKIIWECLKKPLGPLCGFLSQFGFMPLFSYWMGYLFFDNALFRLGLFTLGCSPGGLMSNFWTLMFNGDLNLSITMTFVSTVAALGMMPLWIFTLGITIVNNDKNLQIPFSNLVISLVTLTVPLGIGVLIKCKRPSWASKLSKIIKPFTFGILIFFFTIGIYNSYKLFVLMTFEMYLAGFLVAFSGFLFGSIFAVVWCLKKEAIIAISIETALQNTGTAYIVLKLSLPSPDGDISSLPLMAQAMLTGFGLMIFYSIYLVFAPYFCPVSPKNDTDIKETNGDVSNRNDVEMTNAWAQHDDEEKAKKIINQQEKRETKTFMDIFRLSKKKNSKDADAK